MVTGQMATDQKPTDKCPSEKILRRQKPTWTKAHRDKTSYGQEPT